MVCHICTFEILRITVALKKAFANASNDSSLILVTSSCATNNEIYAKSVTERKKRKMKTRKAVGKRFSLHANAKSSYKNNIQYSPYYVQSPSERPKCQIIQFFSGTSHSGDSHEGTFTASNTSFHLTET